MDLILQMIYGGMQIRNLTNNDDPTIYRVWWWANVVHYK